MIMVLLHRKIALFLGDAYWIQFTLSLSCIKLPIKVNMTNCYSCLTKIKCMQVSQFCSFIFSGHSKKMPRTGTTLITCTDEPFCCTQVSLFHQQSPLPSYSCSNRNSVHPCLHIFLSPGDLSYEKISIFNGSGHS